MSIRYKFRELEIFCAIARRNNVNQAAEELFMTQSAVSQGLARLEGKIGGQLFVRQGRKVILNQHGEAVLPIVHALLDNAAELERILCGDKIILSSIKLMASTTIARYILPQWLAIFRQLYGETRVELTASNTDEVIRAVVDMSVDFGLIESFNHDPRVISEPWLEDELILIASPRHELASKRVTAEDLLEVSWLMRERGSGTRREVERWLLNNVGPVNIDMELGDSEAIWRTVADGLGISILSRAIVASALLSGDLVELHTTLPPLSRMFSIVRHRERPPTRGLDVFLSVASRISDTDLIWNPRRGNGS